MKKLALIITLFLLTGPTAFSQKVSGVVMDSTSKEVLPYATVSAKSKDNKILSGTLTDYQGGFSFQVPTDAASIEISYMSYESHIIHRPFDHLKASQIMLSVSPITLDGVVVQSEKTTSEFLIDRKVINFGTDLQASGGTVIEAFEQLPEIEINPGTGDLRLRGNDQVRILVNGKPSPLNNQDLLAQINTSEVDKVEIITSPSAKYQADGLAGIINIVLQDKVIKGISGSVNINARTNPGYGGSVNLTSGFGRFNIQGTLSHRKNFFINQSNNSRSLLASDLQQRIVASREFDGQVNTINFKTDWFINTHNDLSITVNATNNEHDIDVDTRIGNEQTGEHVDNYLNNFHRHNTRVYNLNYRTRFSEKGDRYLDADINVNENNNRLPNSIFEDDLLLSKNDIFFNNRIVNAAIDMVYPFAKSKLEAGALYTYKQIDNRQISTVNSTESLATYRYDENTYSTYVILKKEMNKLGLQFGLRSEAFKSKGNINGEVAAISRDFFNLFPSVHLSYKNSETLNYSLAYNRRIARPSFYNINPLTTTNDPLYRREGNPALNPQFTDNVELGLHYNTPKIAVNSSLYYRYMTNIINRTFEVDENQITVLKFQNGGESHAVGIETTITKDLSKKLNVSITSSAYYKRSDPQLENFFFESQYNYNFRSKFKYQFTDKFSTDLQFLYYGKGRRLNAESAPYNFVNLAMRYKVLKGKGTINLRFTDLYKGNIYAYTRFGDEVVDDMQWIGQTRVAIASFAYNFSKGDIKKRKAKRKHYNESGALE
jgi:outer membrane receptor protein involved in Fe transport